MGARVTDMNMQVWVHLQLSTAAAAAIPANNDDHDGQQLHL